MDTIVERRIGAMLRPKDRSRPGAPGKSSVSPSLREYKRKRRFDRTPEPAGEASTEPGRLLVVQKHDATRLHYDVRLELDGVLKSWAVPKGPSLDPGARRLAVHTEDHPVEYGSFEGTIPDGEYGAGPVQLWDRGEWFPLDDPHEGYRKGHLKFRVEATKLRGGFVLIRTRGDGGRSGGAGKEPWLLIKEKDEEARPGSGAALVEDHPESVASGRRIEEIGQRVRRGRARRSPAPTGGTSGIDPAAIPGSRPGTLPAVPRPQLAVLADAVPAGDRWIHEIKFDGYRALCRIEGGKARLFTRNAHDWTERFASIATAAERLPVKAALLDGEVVVLGRDGRTSFQELQNALARKRDDDLVYYAFDLLHLDQRDISRCALIDRKHALEKLLKSSHAPRSSSGAAIRYSEHFEEDGPLVFKQACETGLEGILSKRRDLPYRSGRSDEWRKVKCLGRAEFTIVGFTEPEGSRAGFGALLLGARDDRGKLVYAGRVGTGFSERVLREMRKQLDALRQTASPLEEPAPREVQRSARWVAPQLVAEVAYTEVTRDRVLRHPSFLGLREDRTGVVDWESVGKIAAKKAPATSAGTSAARKKSGTGLDATPAGKRPATSTRTSAAQKKPAERASAAAHKGAATRTSASAPSAVRIAGITLTNPERVLYPEQGTTKRMLAAYYEQIGEWILPHVEDRPLTVVRCPEGRQRACFYQKHDNGTFPDALGRVEIPEGSGTGTATYLYVRSLAGLIALVQRGVLELHVWGSRRDRLGHPDRMVFDLDPDVGLDWKRVTGAATRLRERLTDLGLQSFLKTTGGKGLHVVVPLGRRQDWHEVKAFSKAIADGFVREDPGAFTSVISKARRKNRIFIDYLRNGRGATAICAYSTRAREGATVSVPLAWEELTPSLRPERFTVETVPGRVASLGGDPWAGIASVRQTITRAMLREVGL